MTITVKVTQEDIDNGMRHICQMCPIARALKRAGMSRVLVGETTVSTSDGHMVGMLPYSASKFIESFDRGDPVAPFEFSMESEPEAKK